MGMMINRRRVCGGKAEGLEYIQDGLIFWLDGINKGNDPTAWTDLVDGIVLTGNATVRDDCFEFNGSQKLSSSVELPPSPNYLYTVEVCAQNESPVGVIIASGNWNTAGNIFLSLENGQLYNYSNAGNFDKNNLIGLYAASFTSSYYVVNGVQRVPGGGGKINWTNNGTVIGARSTNTKYFKGRIYSIRVYNRILTGEEIIHNQRIDNVRFNLGLNI